MSRAWQRIDGLVDTGTFLEFGARVRSTAAAYGQARSTLPGDGVVTGAGEIGGRPVAVFAQDPGVLGGSLGVAHAKKIAQVMALAERSRCPVVGLLDSGGARIQEGVAALDGYGGIFRANALLSGRVPQVSVILGTCAGGAAYSPGLTDIVIAVTDSQLFLTGPRVVKAAVFENVSATELGGAEMHSRRTGLVHLLARDAAHAADLCREVLSYLPSSCDQPPPEVPARAPLPIAPVPTNQRIVYDVRTVIAGIVDAGRFLELQPGFASNIVVGFARVDGKAVGVVANQPMSCCGVIDFHAAEKAARFVRLCDAFGLPLVTLVDTPGFLPGTCQEHGGVIVRGAKLLYAYASATVPRVTVILRKAFGGAYIAMNSKGLGADAVFAWPTAQVAVMGAQQAVEILHRRDLADDPGLRAGLAAGYEADVMGTDTSAAGMSVDAVIAPHDTRAVVTRTLRALDGAREFRYRHDNMPL